jgi:AGCS family alanine or glycine:cation symporter
VETISAALGWLNGIAWGVPMLILILGIGLYLTVGLRLRSILKVPLSLAFLWRGRVAEGKGEITPFNALMTELSATIGTGNIAGVATAIFLGGPGAIFWMWMTALVGMATKYAEAVLAVRYREQDSRGEYVGGPMYYIRNGLGPKWNWLAICFALFASIAGFGIGNMVQANSVAHALNNSLAIPEWATGAVLFLLVGAVLIGGIQRIAAVDTLNALMAIPNLIALALLSPVVFALSREFFKPRGKSEDNPF